MRKAFTFPAFLPDQPPVGVTVVAENVYPGANGYRPVGSFTAISDPLPASFAGGFAAISTDGTAYLFAGTANGLVRYAGGGWSDLLTAMSVTGRWRFAQFENVVVAVNGIDTKQIDLNAGTASDLAAPNGTSVAVVGPHAVIGGADGDRLRVAWSAFNAPGQWTPGVDQAGFEPMRDGGEVMGLAGGEYGIVLQRFALTRMSLTGDASAPFQFQQITSNVGAASKASIVQAGRTVFFLSDRGFMALEDGQALRPIGNEKVDASFRAAVKAEDYERLWAAVDPKRSIVMWGVPGPSGVVWAYNWVVDRWAQLRLPFTGLFSGYESSLTLEQVSALYPNLDTMPFSLDDPRFAGGDPRLYVVGTGRNIGALSGPSMAARVRHGWTAPAGEQVARVRAVWPMTDATEGVTVVVDARQRMGDGEEARETGVMQRSGRVPMRHRGRFLQVEVKHAAGSAWSYSQGFELEAEAGGTR